MTIGLDLGVRRTQCCVQGPAGARLEERALATTRGAIEALHRRFPGARPLLETSTSARWIAALAAGLGHEVFVANPRNIPVITANVRKCDRNDARLLAELGQVKPELLSPVQLRSDRYQKVRTLLFARAQLVKQRTSLTNFIRAEVRLLGFSLPPAVAQHFEKKCGSSIPDELKPTIAPMFAVLTALSNSIKTYDEQIENLSTEQFPETNVLRQVHGVGPLVALAFVATIGEPA